MKRLMDNFQPVFIMSYFKKLRILGTYQIKALLKQKCNVSTSK